MFQEGFITEKQLQSAEKLAQVINRIPEDKQAILIAVMNAYTDGFIAGNMVDITLPNKITEPQQLSFDDILSGKDV